MAVVVVGMHERDVPLEVFERVAVTEQELHKALAALVAGPNLSEAVILSTCLRTEVYAAVDRFHDGVADIEAFFRARAGAGDGGVGAHAADGHSSGRGEPADGNERRPEAGGGVLELGGGLSCRYDDAAIAYLFEVAAGIDSPVLGEGEILRQVRDAAEAARQESATGTVLGPLFRHAVEAGKRARTETAIQRGTTSLANAAVESQPIAPTVLTANGCCSSAPGRWVPGWPGRSPGAATSPATSWSPTGAPTGRPTSPTCWPPVWSDSRTSAGSWSLPTWSSRRRPPTASSWT